MNYTIVFFFALFLFAKIKIVRFKIRSRFSFIPECTTCLINRGEFFFNLKSIGNLQDRSTGQKRRYQNGERLANRPARSHVKGGKFSRKGNRAGQRYREKLL